MRNLLFESQKNKPWPKIGCGVASLMMLLRYHCAPEKVPDYKTLGNELGVAKTPRQKGYTWYAADSGPGAYIDDVTRWLSKNGLEFMSSYSSYWFAEQTPRLRRTAQLVLTLLVNSPVMVGMVGRKWGEMGHWIVLEDCNQKSLIYLNPEDESRNARKLGRKQFFDEWDGTAVAIQGKY